MTSSPIVLFAIIIVPALGISIDSQLVNTKKECFVRVALGEKLPPSDMTRRVDSPNLSKCEMECSLDMNRCLSFSFGISPKGNGTCELSIREILPSETKITGSITDPDFDVYSKRYNCDNNENSRDPLVSNRPRPDSMFEDDQSSGDKRPQNSGYSQPSGSYDRPSRPSGSYKRPPGWVEPYGSSSRPDPYKQTYPSHLKPVPYGNSKPYEEIGRPSYGGSEYNDRPYLEPAPNAYGGSVGRPYDDYSRPSRPNKPFINPYENQGSTSGTYYEANDDYRGGNRYDDRYQPNTPALYDSTGYGQTDKYGDRMQWGRPSNAYLDYQQKRKYPMSYGEQYSYDRFGSSYGESERYYYKKPLLDYDNREPGMGYPTYGNSYKDYVPSTYYDKPLGPGRPLYGDYDRSPGDDNIVYGDKIAVAPVSSYGNYGPVKHYGKRPQIYDDSYRGNGYDNLPGKYNYENRDRPEPGYNRRPEPMYNRRPEPEYNRRPEPSRPDDSSYMTTKPSYTSGEERNKYGNDNKGETNSYNKPEDKNRPDPTSSPSSTKEPDRYSNEVTSERPNGYSSESTSNKPYAEPSGYGNQNSNNNKPTKPYDRPSYGGSYSGSSYSQSASQGSSYQYNNDRPTSGYDDRYSSRPDDRYSSRPDDRYNSRPDDRYSSRPNLYDYLMRPNEVYRPRPDDGYGSRPDPGYGGRPDDRYPARPIDNYGPRPDDRYPVRPVDNYGLRPDDRYPARPIDNYGSRPDPGYASRPDPAYSARPDPAYPARPDPGYPARPDDSYGTRPTPVPYRPEDNYIRPYEGYAPRPSPRPDDAYPPRPISRPDDRYPPRPDNGYGPQPAPRPDDKLDTGYGKDREPLRPVGRPRPIPYDQSGEWLLYVPWPPNCCPLL